MSTTTAAASKTSEKKPLIIFCHGSGDTGPGVQAWIESLVPPQEYHNWDWLFPSAKPIPYQLNGCMVTSVWYDRVGGFAPTFPEQTASAEQSTMQLMNLIEEQIAKEGRSPSEIILGGFSMGGAISYQTAARWHASGKGSLGAVFGLSCYLNHDSKVWDLLKENPQAATAKAWPPTFIAHGAMDDFILPEWGQGTYKKFQELGIPVNFKLVPYAHHEMTPGEIGELLQFLKSTLEENAKQPSSDQQQQEL